MRTYFATLTIPAVGATDVTGFLNLLPGRILRIWAIGLDSAGDLVDDLLIAVNDPRLSPVIDADTPARAIADPRNYVAPTLNLEADNNDRWQVKARCVASTNVTVKVTFEQLIQ